MARTNDPNRVLLIEDAVRKYLGTDVASSLERLRKAIDREEAENRQGEDWTHSKKYVRSLLQRLD